MRDPSKKQSNFHGNPDANFCLGGLVLCVLVFYDRSVLFCGTADSTESNPQTLLFSATLPHWVHETAKKYLRLDRRHFDLISDDSVRTSKTVRVGSGCTVKPCTK